MKTFNKFSDSFFYYFLDLYPSGGHYLGLHEYDGRINIVTKDEHDNALKYFQAAFMEEATALQEAERAVFDPGYLSYTLGKIKLKDLKEKYFEKNNNSSLKEFHDKIVFLGAPTFRIAEKIILDTP